MFRSSYNTSLMREHGALIVVVLAALMLRLLGIGYGLPHSYWNDEYHEVMRALELGSGHFNFNRTGKGGLYLLLFVEYGVYFVFLKVTGAVNSAMDFALHFTRDPSTFYYLGRLTSVIFGVVTVVITYAIGRRAYGKTAGILAAVFLAVNTLHVDLSHRIVVDAMMTCFVAATLLVAIKLAEDGARSSYLLAAALAAIATTTKLPAIILIAPLLIAHGYAVSKADRPIRAFLMHRYLWLAAAIFAFILLASNPGLLFSGSNYLQLFANPDADSASDLGRGAELLAERPNLFIYYLTAMQQSMGWPLALVGVAGVAHGLLKRTQADVILISFGFVFYLTIASSTSQHLYFPRYALPILVVVAILAARSVQAVLERVLGKNIAISGAVLVALIAVPGVNSTKHGYLLTQKDSRTLAKEWIEANVPSNSHVAIEGAKLGPIRLTVPLQDTRESMKSRLQYWRANEPRQATFLELKLAVLDGVGYKLELITIESLADLATYRDMGVEYFVLRPQSFMSGGRSTVHSAMLLEQLRSDVDVALVYAIESDLQKRLGPTIEVYRIKR